MADVVGVVFPNGTKTYYFDPAGLQLSRGDRVVVHTANGPEIGQVVEPTHTIDDSELPAPLKKVTRLATGKDLEARAASQSMRKEAMATCRELIAAHGLDMKLVSADISFGGEKITFSFYADERVDFRDLVADLAKTLKTRVELRQVGAREEARMVGGLGPCGRGLCCTLFPPGDEPVSIRMAKEQNLPLNPAKISGLCGRLMCCLKYEQDQYVRFRKEAPPKGTPVSTPAGDGVVYGYNVLKDSILVKFEDGTSTAVRLDTCQCREDGGLLVVPAEVEPETVPVTALADALEAIGALAEVESGSEELTVVEAEVVLGADGEPVEVIVAESVRPARSRRGRGRRGGRGRSRREGGETGAAGNAGQGRDAAAPAAAPEGAKAGHGDSAVSGEGSRSSRSRRRRRPRRSSGDGGSSRDSGGAPAD